MNRDGCRKILIYLQNIHQSYEGDVLAFSANRNQSLSQMSFTPAKDNSDLHPDYRGGDEFGLVEHQLMNHFVPYINSKVTGCMTQVVLRYK